MDDAGVVRSERRGPAAVLTFNRPDKLNAITSGMLRELDRRLDEVEADAAVRAVVLTGAGERAFVAGADIGEYADGGHEEFVRYQQESRRLFSRIDAFPRPVIGAVNGYALGGGFEIALCCDVLVASRTASFGLPEGLLGLSPGGGGTQRLTRAAGPFVAADVLLAARRLSADDAFRLGLVADVVEPDDLLGAAVAKAEAMAKVAPLSSREMLGLVRTGMEAELEAGLTAEHEALFRLHRSADAAEGIRAFVEKRDPRFTGE
ncbi:MAG: enoyl-CoA hydratase/isomerase family protein [Actinomycetota bacterium]